MIRSKREVPRDVRNSKVGDKTSSGDIGLDIRTHASPKVGQDQVSGGVSVLCWSWLIQNSFPTTLISN